jgi:hypothetical protein
MQVARISADRLSGLDKDISEVLSIIAQEHAAREIDRIVADFSTGLRAKLVDAVKHVNAVATSRFDSRTMQDKIDVVFVMDDTKKEAGT